jgi:hypothetical protein
MSRKCISPPTDIVVENYYIHDLKSTGFDPHYDGIQLHGGVTSDVTIRHTLRF